MRTLPVVFVLAIGGLFASSLAPAPAAVAGPDAESEPPRVQQLFMVRDTVVARYAIEEAQRLLKAGEHLRGLRAAQSVLDEMQDDYFLREDASVPASTLWTSASEVARDILSGLEPEVRATYEELIRPSAEPLIQRATLRGDQRELEEVLRRYGASRFGVRAARLLTELALESGRLRDAARFAWEGLRFAPEDLALWQRALRITAALGDRARLASATWPPAMEPYGLAALRTALLADIPPIEAQQGWAAWGGTMQRDRAHPQEPPAPSHLRWMEPLDPGRRDLDNSHDFPGLRVTPRYVQPLLRKLQPNHAVSGGRTVFVADGRSVRALDAFSGRALWHFDATTHPRLGLWNARSSAPGRTSLERAFAPVLAGELLIATVEIEKPFAEDRLQGVVINEYLPRRRVVALDRKTGELVWMMAQRGVDALSLADTTVIAPVAVSEGQVLALTGTYLHTHNVQLTALDLATGRMRWRRALGDGQQELNLFGSPLKELSGTAVAVADGVAYAATGLGFVAAVDTRTGVPRWLASYETLEVSPVEYWFEAPLRRPLVAPTRTIVHGDALVVAPTDGKHVHVFDRATGRLRWREAYGRAGLRHDAVGHLVGVVNDGRRDVVLMSDAALRALDLKTGEPRWVGRFDPERAAVRGAPAIAGDVVLVPTDEGLQRISLKKEGAFLGRLPWPRGARPGNLLPLAQALLMTTRGLVQAFYDWDTIAADVERRRREHPKDPTILVDAGELYLRGGQLDRAQEAFDAAVPLARDASDEVRTRAMQGRFRTWLAIGDGSGEGAPAAYRHALAVAPGPDERIAAHLRLHAILPAASAQSQTNLEALAAFDGSHEAVFDDNVGAVPVRAMSLLLLAALHRDAGRLGEAVDSWQRILRDDGARPLGERTAGELAARDLGEVLATHGRDAYARHDEAAQQLLRRAVRAEDETALSLLLVQYPNALVHGNALSARARLRAAQGRVREAAGDLRTLVETAPVPTEQAKALALLAQVEAQAGAVGAAHAALAALRDEHATTTFTVDGKAWTGATWTVADLEQREAVAKEATLVAPLREAFFEPAGDETSLRLLPVSVDASAGTPPYALVSRGHEISAVDLRAGTIAWRIPIARVRLTGWTPGRFLLVARGRLLAVDSKTGAIIWERPQRTDPREIAVGDGQVFVLRRDRQADGGQVRVQALDAYTGVPLWNTALGTSDPRQMQPAGRRLLLRRTRYEGLRRVNDLLVLDAFSGRLRHELRLPSSGLKAAVRIGARFMTGGRDPLRKLPMVIAFDLDTGQAIWRRVLEGNTPVVSLAETPEGFLLVLRNDGELITLDPLDGRLEARTRAFLGEGTTAQPMYGMGMHVTDTSVVWVPSMRRRGAGIVAFDRATGKLLWEHAFDPGRSNFFVNRCLLERSGDLFWTFVVLRGGSRTEATLRILDAKGRLVQRIEPEGLTRSVMVPSATGGHGSILLVGHEGMSLLRGAAR